MRELIGKIWQRRPLVVVLAGLIVVIILLGILLVAKQCSGIGLQQELRGGDRGVTPGAAASDQVGEPTLSRLDSIVLRAANRLYGLPVAGYDLLEGQVARGETFSRLLNDRFGVNILDINRLIELSDGVFNLRDIRAGNPYTAFLSQDSARSLRYLVYEKSRSEYITFGLSDSLYVRVDKKEVRTRERYSEGVITSSLFATIYEEGLSDELVIQMEQIYGSTIDFYRLQKGDHFRVLYEEQFIDSISIGVTRIFGVEFTHINKPYYAFRFQQDGEWGYWNETGRNLQGNLLLSPLKLSYRISSRFGSRVHPIRRVRRMHYGVDYACPSGTPVHSVADGVVTRRGWDSAGGGNFIWVRHTQGYESGYLHLSRFAVKAGQRVSQGQLIAYSGNTGGSTGPHLDYRLRRDGKYLNPLTVTSTPKEPIKAANKAAFDKMRGDVMKVLEQYDSNRPSDH